MNSKIIESVNHAFIEPIIRTPVDNILFCSGGGIAATFFTLGAIKQLLDNNKLLNTFDIISATSGSVITLILVELCYDNNLVGVVPDWYERYVVQNLHNYFNDNWILNTLKRMDVTNLNKNSFWRAVSSYWDNVPKLKPSVKSRKQKKPIFLYNYINVNTSKLTTDHSDLLYDKYKIAKTIFRCVMPLNNINGIPSNDAALANNLGSNILNTYAPKFATVIAKEDYFIYDKYLPFSWMNYGIIQLFSPANIEAVNSSSDILNSDNTILITLSSSLYPSKSKYHRGVFTDYHKQLTSPVVAYYAPYNLFLVFQNEGCIQANTALKLQFATKNKNKKIKTVFQIPNQSVYKIAKTIVPSEDEKCVLNMWGLGNSWCYQK